MTTLRASKIMTVAAHIDAESVVDYSNQFMKVQGNFKEIRPSQRDLLINDLGCVEVTDTEIIIEAI